MPALPTLPYNPLRKQHLRDIDSPSPRRNKEGADVRTRKRSEPKRPLYPIDKSNIESPRDNTAVKRKVKALYSNTTSPFFDITGEAPRPFDPRTMVSDNESESSGIEDLMSRATRERNASLAHAGPPSGRSMTKISEFGEKLKSGSLAIRFASDSFRTTDTRPPQRERLSSSSLSQRPSHARGDISLARSKSTPITRPLAEDKQTTVKLVTRRSGRVAEAADAMHGVLPFTPSRAPSTFDKPLPAPPTLERASAYVQNGEPLPGPLIGDGFVLNEENVRRARDLERERCQQWDEIIAQSVDAAAAGNPRTGRRSPHRGPSHDILAAHSPYMTWGELLPAPSGIPEIVRIDSPEPELDSEPEFDSIDLPLHSHGRARSSMSLRARERNRTRSSMPPRSYSSPSGAGRHPIDPVTYSSPARLESQRSCPPVPNSAASSYAAKARRGVPSAVKHPRNTHTSVQQPRPDYYGDANIAKRAAELKQIAEKDAEYQRWQRQYEEDKRFRQELA